MAQIQGNNPHPVARWVSGLGDLGRQALHLLHPLACAVMASSGAAAVAVSPTFRTLGTRAQFFVLWGLGMYTVLTGCIAFGTWSTDRVLNTTTRVNRFLVCTFRLVTLGIVVWVASVTFVARDYPLALGVGTLAIQSQYMSYHQGYVLPSRNIVVGLLSIGAMVVIREFHNYVSVVLGLAMVAIAALLFSCN